MASAYREHRTLGRIPTAGTAAEIDRSSLMRIDNVHITTSGFSTPLVGAPGFAATSTQISSTWTFASGGLPATFANGGTISYLNNDVPNVYAGP